MPYKQSLLVFTTGLYGYKALIASPLYGKVQ